MRYFQVLIRRFQITRNLSLDGVLDFLNSKRMTDAGPVDLINDENDDINEGVDRQTRVKLGGDLPGFLPNRGRLTVRTKCLKIAPTGRSWAAATTEGVILYSVDDSFVFDPTDLDIDVTPEVWLRSSAIHILYIFIHALIIHITISNFWWFSKNVLYGDHDSCFLNITLHHFPFHPKFFVCVYLASKNLATGHLDSVLLWHMTSCLN